MFPFYARKRRFKQSRRPPHSILSERRYQALAHLLPDRASCGVFVLGACVVPADQPQDRQPVAPAAHRPTREPIDGHAKARGYEIGKGQFLLVEDQDLEAIEIGSTHTIDIDSFVPRAKIDQRFFDTPCYIT